MHEHSLVSSLLRQVEDIVAAHEGSRVAEIRVEVGPLSGVEPLLVQSAFETLAPDTVAGRARLQIDDVPLGGRCRECEERFTIEDFHFRCSACGAAAIEVTSGDEFRLLDITLVEPEPAGEAPA